jgi:hypothetical protein
LRRYNEVGDLTAVGGKLYRERIESPETSLYERLGGVYAIAAVVDDFPTAVMVSTANAMRRTIAFQGGVQIPGDGASLLAAGGPQKHRAEHAGFPRAPENTRRWKRF